MPPPPTGMPIHEVTPRWLRLAMLLHALTDVIGGILLFFWPGVVHTVGYPEKTNYLLARVFAAALFSIAWASWRASQKTTAPSTVAQLLQSKIIWAFTVMVASIAEIASWPQGRPGNPVLPWATITVLVVFMAGLFVWMVGLYQLTRRIKQHQPYVLVSAEEPMSSHDAPSMS